MRQSLHGLGGQRLALTLATTWLSSKWPNFGFS